MKRIQNFARGVTGGVRPRHDDRGAPEVGAHALKSAAKALDTASRPDRNAPDRGRLRDVNVGTSRSGLAPAHVYLPENRFEWWWATPPASGGVVIDPSGSNPESRAEAAFLAEFASGSLATVTGANPSPPTSARKLAWDAAAGGLPQNLEESGFAVHRAPGASDPQLRRLSVRIRADRPEDRVVLTSARAGDEPSPRLVIEFATAQRAVGLEAGFVSDEPRGLNQESFVMTARNASGAVVAMTTGADLVVTGDPNWQANQVRRLALRSQAGDITEVEFWCDDPGLRADDRLFVLRLWNEPLPAAAVAQIVLTRSDVSTFVSRQVANHPDTLNERVFRAPKALALPFGCDRAVAILRGFKVGWADRQQREVGRIEAAVWKRDNDVGRYPPNFATTPGGTISLVIDSLLGDGEALGDAGGVYVSVIAWNTRLVDMFATASDWRGNLPERSFIRDDASNQHPPVPETEALGRDPFSVFGELYAGLTRFALRREPDDLERCAFLMPLQGGTGTGDPPELSLPQPRFGQTKLDYVGDRISLVAAIDCGDEEDDPVVEAGLSTVILNGSGLVTLPIGLLLQRINMSPVHGRARQDSPFLRSASDLPGTLNYPLDAEMAAIGLGFCTIEPDDEATEIDVELRGDRYDGTTTSISVGFGVTTEDQDFTCYMGALPWVVGIVRKPVRNVRTLAVAGADFEWSPNVLTLSPRRPGLISNTGTLPISILSVRKEGDHPGEFDVDIAFRGQTERIDTRLARGPLTLAVGESAAIGGRFYSQATGGVRSATFTLVVDSLVSSTEVALPLRAEPVVLAPGEGFFAPTTINFGFVHAMVTAEGEYPQNLRWHRLLLANGGAGPLVISSLGFANAVPGLSWGIVDAAPVTGNVTVPGARYQISPGEGIIVQINYAPPAPGSFETAFEAATPTGVLRARILGQGVS